MVYKIVSIEINHTYWDEQVILILKNTTEFKTKQEAEDYIKENKIKYVTILEIYD